MNIDQNTSMRIIALAFIFTLNASSAAQTISPGPNSGEEMIERQRENRDSESIASAWALVKCKDGAVKATRKERIQYFLGFVDGRLQFSSPEWWRRSVLAEPIAQGTLVFNDSTRWAIELKKNEGLLRLFNNRHEYSLQVPREVAMSMDPDSELAFAASGTDVGIAIIGRDEALGAAPNDVVPILMYDLTTMKLRWQTVVRRDPVDLLGVGPLVHRAQVVLTIDSLILAGEFVGKPYIAAFDRKEGKVRAAWSMN
ncbi:MAG: hypothetical protein KDA57_17005 [Planctomycetales bacterium]|nr:hypothetical protein [Planctomycetales bacterium]